MKGKVYRRIWAALSVVTAAAMLSGCGLGEMQSEDLMKKTQQKKSQESTKGENRERESNIGEEREETAGFDTAAAVTDFGVRLLQNCPEEEDNPLISPLSVLASLGMAANGAEGETLAQMEEVFGVSVPELNLFFRDYMSALPTADKYKLSMANAMWLRDLEDIAVDQDFLQVNGDYYDAGLYQAPFDDTTLKEINDWVEKNTDGMIKDALDRISEDTVMYLVNALAFDAEWMNIYYDHQIREGEFTREDGEIRQIVMMYSDEYQYLKDENAEGFLKYYADGKYAFGALLPTEGISVEEYLKSLTGEKLRQILTAPLEEEVYAAIPKFESRYHIELADVLQEMGMKDAFVPGTADFSHLGDYEVFISRVIHKTYISVDERGTRAGAVTITAEDGGGAMPMEPKTVHLNRPFLYVLMDCDTCLPVFIGIVRDVQ